MNLTKFFNNERVNGFSHLIELDYTDLQTAGLTLAKVLCAAEKGVLVRSVAWKLVTPFVGTGVTALTLQLGYNLGAGVDDPNGFIEAKSVLNGVAPVEYATGGGAALLVPGGYVFLENATIELLATAVGANLSLLTAGRIGIVIDMVELDGIARAYEAE